MFQKKDRLIIAGIIVTATVSALLIVFLTAFEKKNTGEIVRITIDGVIYGEYSLSENQSVLVDGELGQNRLVIENNSAYMAGADCPDRYCMDYEPISYGGETIICLPHRLVVEVVGKRAAQQPDVIVP